jgi:UPF0755 protein
MLRVFSLIKIVVSLIIVGAVFVGIDTYLKLYVTDVYRGDSVRISVGKGESIQDLADRLERDGVIVNSYYFRKFLVLGGVDRTVQSGEFRVDGPITIARISEALKYPILREEREITLIPGWSLIQYRVYLVAEGLTTGSEFDRLVGSPAVQKRGQVGLDLRESKLEKIIPNDISLEGYLAPETYRIFVGESIESILRRLVRHTDSIFTDDLLLEIEGSGRSVHQIMTLASIIERESPDGDSMPAIAGVFTKRLDADWPLQADSTVHYLQGKFGDVFSSASDRESDNPWNTYRYRGLPPGPIAAPSITAIRAAIHPEENDYWYFITTLDTGEVKFARTLSEHNTNVSKYLR